MVIYGDYFTDNTAIVSKSRISFVVVVVVLFNIIYFSLSLFLFHLFQNNIKIIFIIDPVSGCPLPMTGIILMEYLYILNVRIVRIGFYGQNKTISMEMHYDLNNNNNNMAEIKSLQTNKTKFPDLGSTYFFMH